MKIVVTHTSPDLDAISSVWLIHRFLPGWDDAKVEFVPAGERKILIPAEDLHTMTDPIEKVGEDEVIHVDTGLGPLDHHQTQDDTVCGASRTWDYVQTFIKGGEKWEEKKEAISRMVKVVVAIDHFKEVFWPDAAADHHEFSLFGLLEGLKLQRMDQDEFYTQYVEQALDALLHNFENRIWAEREIKDHGKTFESRFGKGIAFDTINDTVLKLAQKMGYVLVVRKDPRKGYVRIKARPAEEGKNIDLTLAYEQLSKMDPDATWFLHVSKKMLLNGTVKNPKMKPTKLSLEQIVNVLKSI